MFSSSLSVILVVSSYLLCTPVHTPKGGELEETFTHLDECATTYIRALGFLANQCLTV